MQIFVKNMSINAVILAAFAFAGTSILAYTYSITKPIIIEERKQYLLRSLNKLIPEDKRDNDIFNDVIYVTHPDLLGSEDPVAVYRIRMKGEPVAVVINSIAPNGYSGKIYLIVAINYQGGLDGVRVSNHTETPGLGDRIDIRKSDWIDAFANKSLTNTNNQQWAVKKDRGIFDEFTGATITPRAVVKAVQNTLLYFKENRDSLFVINEKSTSKTIEQTQSYEH